MLNTCSSHCSNGRPSSVSALNRNGEYCATVLVGKIVDDRFDNSDCSRIDRHPGLPWMQVRLTEIDFNTQDRVLHCDSHMSHSLQLSPLMTAAMLIFARNVRIIFSSTVPGATKST